MADMPDQTRNLNPTPAAKVARIIWGDEYSSQGGGTMDFWDRLSPSRKRRCELVVTAKTAMKSTTVTIVRSVDFRTKQWRMRHGT